MLCNIKWLLEHFVSLCEYKIPRGWIHCRTVVVSMAFIPVLDAFLNSEATRAGFWQPVVLSEPLVLLLSALSSTAPCSTKQCTWSCAE